jgi:hypothetical protein
MMINVLSGLNPFLGKGEVECSIHSGSTTESPEISAFLKS